MTALLLTLPPIMVGLVVLDGASCAIVCVLVALRLRAHQVDPSTMTDDEVTSMVRRSLFFAVWTITMLAVLLAASFAPQ